MRQTERFISAQTLWRERESLLRQKHLCKGNESVAKIEPCTIESHFDNCKIKAKKSWIRIEGFPLSL